jgi:hypothetical protein
LHDFRLGCILDSYTERSKQLMSQFYKTAITTVSTNQFQAGEFVGIKPFTFDGDKVTHYEVTARQSGEPLTNVIVLPAHQMHSFCF